MTTERKGLSKAEPEPKHNDSAPIWDLVIQDIVNRDEAGRAKYGTPLQAFNGRDQLVDAYQEALDLTVYLRAAIEERNASRAPGAASRLVDAMLSGSIDKGSEEYKTILRVRSALYGAGL